MVMELVAQIPNAEPDREAIEMQVKTFSQKATELLKDADQAPIENEQSPVDDTSVAKIFEEVKVMFQDLPSRMEERIADAVRPFGRRRGRRFHPLIMEEIMHMGVDSDDPIGLLVAASMVRDEMPWFYEVALEAYRAIKSGDSDSVEREIGRLRRLPDMLMRGPFMEEMGKDMQMLVMELPRMFNHLTHRYLERKVRRVKSSKSSGEA
jgi:hypothetical protein